MARRSGGRGISGQVRAIAFGKGVMGRSGPWFAVWAAMWLVRRISGRSSQTILLSEELKPGDRIMISNARGTVDGRPLDAVRGKSGKVVPVRRLRGRRRRKAEKRAAASEQKAIARADARRGRGRKRGSRRSSAKMDA